MPIVPQGANINTSSESQGLLSPQKPSQTNLLMAAAIMDQHGKFDSKAGPGTGPKMKPPKRGR